MTVADEAMLAAPIERFDAAYQTIANSGNNRTTCATNPNIRVCIWAGIEQDPSVNNRSTHALGWVATIEVPDTTSLAVHSLTLFKHVGGLLTAHNVSWNIPGNNDHANRDSKGSIPKHRQELAVVSGLLAVEFAIADALTPAS